MTMITPSYLGDTIGESLHACRSTLEDLLVIWIKRILQVMPLNSLRISLADYVQLSLQAGFIQRPAIRHPYHHVKG